MTRLLFACGVCAVAAYSCLCPVGAGAVKGEEAISVCEGVTYDNLNGRVYRIELNRDEIKTEHWVTLRITKNCDIIYPEDLSPVSVRAMSIKWPRSARDVTLVLRTTFTDKAGRGIVCSGPLVESGPMKIFCPPEAGNLSYHLQPMD